MRGSRQCCRFPSKSLSALQGIKRTGKGCSQFPTSCLPRGWKARQPNLGPRSCSYGPAVRSRAPASKICVSMLSTCCSQRHVLGFAPSRAGLGHRGADPAITGAEHPSTAFDATEASSSMARIYLKVRKSSFDERRWPGPLQFGSNSLAPSRGSGPILLAILVGQPKASSPKNGSPQVKSHLQQSPPTIPEGCDQ